MPQGDRTGPTGEGPMTGRGAGHCAGPGSLTSPQRRKFFTENDILMSKMLDQLRDKLPDGAGQFYPQTTRGAAFFSNEVGPSGLHIIISFKDGKTCMEICQKGEESTPTIFKKMIDGYNLDSSVRFLKDAERIVTGINSLY